jgi:hypothetical protein
MKAIILTAIVVALEAGFVASIATAPTLPTSSPAQSDVVAGRHAAPAPTAAPASRS